MPPVPTPLRPSYFAWILLGLVAIWVGWNATARASRIVRVTDLPEWSVDAPVVDFASPTGYQQGWRRLILPEHTYASYQWITHAQELLATRQWRRHRIGYENAPLGRSSHLSSPYAWWLAGMAWVDHLVTGHPPGVCVERAALYADPGLQALFAVLVLVTAWQLLDGIAAAVAGLALLAWFPLSGNFLPGAPDRAGLVLGVNLLAALLLVAALRDTPGDPEPAARRRTLFVIAGALHGFGLWLDAMTQAPIIAGYCAGGFAFVLMAKKPPGTAGLWRGWAAAGAMVALLGYVAEYAPGEMNLQLAANHPLYALAWIGLVEVVMEAGRLASGPRVWRAWVRMLAGLALASSLPVMLFRSDDPLPWLLNPDAARLSVMPAVSAENFGAWLRRDGLSLPVLATILPVVVAALAVSRRRPGAGMIVLAGPVLLLGVLACAQLAWWSTLQGCLLALLIAALPPARLPGRVWVGAVAGAGLPGLLVLSPARSTGERLVLNESELAGIVERDLAHRLARHVPVGVVLAPPGTTAALHFYAGLEGLGTFAWENRAGLTAAARIASASSPDEAAELMRGRNVTHIVMPGWDNFLDEYAGLGRTARTGAPVADNSFVAALHRWEPPPWLRPRAHAVPAIGETESQPSVTLFEVTDLQDAPTAMSRLAEYFIETGRPDHMEAARQALASFPAHIGALAAVAKIEAAQGNGPAFAGTVSRILPLLTAKADRNLAWDRRVTLAIVLYSAKQTDLARQQLERCLREATEPRLHSLSAQSTLQFLLLAKRLDLALPSPELARLAVSLLPPDSRARLQ